MPNIIKQIVTNKPNTIKMIVKSSERGAQGVQGIPGTAATIEAGQAYSVSPDSEPSVQNVGSSSAAVFDFYIPKGEQGEPGAPGVNGKDGKDGVDGAVQYKAGVGIVIDPTTNTISATGQAIGGAWGTITGDIADQTDLQEEFGEYTKTADLATVATSGSYSDLSNTPTIPAAQIQSDWAQTNTGSVDFIKNKPTIPTVNNATLTIKHDGTSIATFTANSATDTEANIVSPVQIGSTLSPTNPVAYVGTSNIVNGAVTLAKIDTPSLVDFFYPVGTYYETSDTSFNPNTAWGGTWVEDTAGRVLVAMDTGTFTTVGATGGEETHTLTKTEMPSHNHGVHYWINSNLPGGSDRLIAYGNTSGQTPQYQNSTNWVSNTGGDGAHNNLQPYIVVKRWHRTA